MAGAILGSCSGSAEPSSRSTVKRPTSGSESRSVACGSVIISTPIGIRARAEPRREAREAEAAAFVDGAAALAGACLLDRSIEGADGVGKEAHRTAQAGVAAARADEAVRALV